MHPEPWPAAHHLPTIVLAIVLAAALVAATVVVARFRLGLDREADTRTAQFGFALYQTRVATTRVRKLEENATATANALASRLAEVEARIDMLQAEIRARA